MVAQDITNELIKDIAKSLGKGIDKEKLMKKFEPKFKAAVEKAIDDYIKHCAWDEYFADGFYDKETYKALNAMLIRVFNSIK